MSEFREVSPRRRYSIVVGFAALLAGAGFLNSAVKRHDISNLQGERLSISAVALGAEASSAAWYCPGPLPLGHSGETSAIAITNLSSRDLTGQVHIATSAGGVKDEPIGIARLHESVIALPAFKKPTYGAISLLVDGPGVGVSEIVRDGTGMTSSPCSTHTSPTEYFAAGSSAGAANVAVSLYNPGATPAVANLSFFSGNSSTMPAAFTSVPVEPGQDVVFFAGRALPQRQVLSAAVSTVSGEIVAGNLDFMDVANQLTSSLVVGAPVAQSAWWFAPTVVGRGIHQVFSLVNPTANAESVHLTLVGAGGQGAFAIAIAPHASVAYSPPALKQVAGVQGAYVTTSANESVIVDRGLVITHRVALSPASTRDQLPALLVPGFGVTAATPQPSSTWMMASGQSNPDASEFVGVFNPQDVPVKVKLRQLVDGVEIPISGLATVTVTAHGTASINMARYVTGRNALALVLVASRPVVAGATEFARANSGVSAPAATPVR